MAPPAAGRLRSCSAARPAEASFRDQGISSFCRRRNPTGPPPPPRPPRGAFQTARRAPTSRQQGKESGVVETSGPVSVLVVDDEEPIRNALKKFLAQQQFDVYTAGSGDEALQQLHRHKVALMLCDIRMPGTSGVDLVQIGRAHV